MALDDLAAISLVYLAVKERAGENFKRGPAVDTALAQQRQNLAHTLQRQSCNGNL